MLMSSCQLSYVHMSIFPYFSISVFENFHTCFCPRQVETTEKVKSGSCEKYIHLQQVRTHVHVRASDFISSLHIFIPTILQFPYSVSSISKQLKTHCYGATCNSSRQLFFKTCVLKSTYTKHQTHQWLLH